MHRFDLFFRLWMIAADYIILIVSFILSYFLRVGWIFSTDFPFSPYVSIALLVSLVWVSFFAVFTLYGFHQRTDTRGHFAKLILVNILGTGTFLLFFFTFRKLLFSRWILVYVFIISTILLIFSHFLAQKIREYFVRKMKGVSRVLIIGSNRTAEKLILHLLSTFSKHVPIAVLDAYGSSHKEVGGVPILGKLNILEKVVADEKINEIIQVDNLEQTLNIITFCQKHHLGYAMLPSLLGVFHDAIQLEVMEFQPVIRLAQRKKRWFERFI